jgi:hypothetical protein
VDEHQMVDALMTLAHQHLHPDEIRLAEHFFSQGEPELAIEFLCDLFFEYEIIFPESFGDLIKEVASELNLRPEQTWEQIIVEDKKTHSPYRLYTGKNPVLILQEVESIFSEVGHKFSPELFDAVREFIDVNECELAIDGICTGLLDGKIRISKEFLSRISTAIIDTHGSSDDFEELMDKKGLLEE